MSANPQKPLKSRANFQLFIVLAILLALFGAAGQEISTIPFTFDDAYFLQRSESFTLENRPHHHLAPIKEYGYSLFVRASRSTGLSLRTTQALAYALAVLMLWKPLLYLLGSRRWTWPIILILLLFSMQHEVFNRATSDALQLILLPLTFATAISIWTTRGSWLAIIAAAIVAGAHAYTRPEGLLFAAPPLGAWICVLIADRLSIGHFQLLRRSLAQGLFVCLIPLGFQHLASAQNRIHFDFYAPDITKAAPFVDALRQLMAIDPGHEHTHRHASVPRRALEAAWQESPSFALTKPFFEINLDGRGWSSFGGEDYATPDGSIPGGWFQWALLEASASVAGPEPRDILKHLEKVADEIRSAFDGGRVARRPVIATFLGPNFSVRDPSLYASLVAVGQRALFWDSPVGPIRAHRSNQPWHEDDFDRLALRRTSLLDLEKWSAEGWALVPQRGHPQRISLDRNALHARISLKQIERPDLSEQMTGIGSGNGSATGIGFELEGPRFSKGNLLLHYQDATYQVPLQKLVSTSAPQSFVVDPIIGHLDRITLPEPALDQQRFRIATFLSHSSHLVCRLAIPLAAGLMLFLPWLYRRGYIDGKATANVLVLLAVSLPLVASQWILFSALDAFMYSGNRYRYLASTAFPMALASLTALVIITRGLFRRCDGEQQF